MQRAAGALARSRHGLSPAAALCAQLPGGGGSAGAALGALSPAAGARPIFGLVKKWTGVTERDTQISDLQAENAAHLETLGDLQVCASRHRNAPRATPRAARLTPGFRAGRAAAHARRAERCAEARGGTSSGESKHHERPRASGAAR